MDMRNKYLLRGEIVDTSHEAKAYGVPLLSLIRTSKSNTCFYRSLFYVSDVRARMLTLGSPFEDRFSVKRLLPLEILWLSDRLSPLPRKVQHCLDFFAAEDGPNLPTEPENGAMMFKIVRYKMVENRGDRTIRSVKRLLDIFCPIIGGLKLCLDYFNEDDEVYLAEDLKITMENLHLVRIPPRVESPVRTPTPPPLTPPSPPEQGEVPEVAQEIPKQRKRANAHAVCIVGYCTVRDKYETDRDCFIVQDSFGSKFRDGGFSLIPVHLFRRFFYVKLEKI